MDQGHFMLSELLVNDEVSRVGLCKRALGKALEFLSLPETGETLQEGICVKTELVLQCLQTLTVLLKDIETKDFAEVGSDCFRQVCVPFLRWLSREQASLSQLVCARALKTVALSLSSLIEGDRDLLQEIIRWFALVVKDELYSQQAFQSAQHSEATSLTAVAPDFMSSSVILPVLQFMLESSDIQTNSEYFQELFEALLNMIVKCDSEGHIFLISSTLLPLFITGGQTSRLEMIWELVKSVHSNKTTVESNSLDVALTLLSCLHDVFIVHDDSSPFSLSYPANLFDVTGGHALLDLRKEDTFWSIIQDGLTNPDPLSRKRCMYLLHCVLLSVQKSSGEAVSSASWVFWWDSESAKQLLAIWNDLVLVLETLEEKQVHIVKPVKKHLQNLIRATRMCNNGHSLLHISWLTVALTRIFVHHEAKSIIKWGVQETLDMPLENSPLLMRENWGFLLGPLLEVLNETAIYGRDPNTLPGNCPPIAKSLYKFLGRFLAELHSQEEASSFLTQFLSSCCSIKMADIPLVFVSFALSKLPPQPLLGPKALAGIRSIVLNCLLTHKPSLRSAIQCFLLTAVCNLTNAVQITCGDLIQTLGCFRSTECLLYNSSPWKQACCCLVEFCTGSRPTSPNNTADSADVIGSTGCSLFTFLSECVANCVRDEKDPLLPGEQQVARAILLAICAEVTTSTRIMSTKERSLSESLTLLVAPFMDLLAGAHTRLYLSHSSVLSSIELLTSMLEQLLQGDAPNTRDDVEQVSDTTEGHSVGSHLYKVLLPWLPDIMVYVQDRLFSEGSQFEADLYLTGLYSSALDVLYRFMKQFGYSFDSSRDLGPKPVAQRALDYLHSVCSNQPVCVTPTFLGAVTALSWVCALPAMSSMKYRTHNDDQLSVLSHQSLPGHSCDGDQFELVRSISQLPMNLAIIRPDSSSTVTSTADVEGRGLLSKVEVVGERKIESDVASRGGIKLTASRRKTEWGPLITHCYSCYWRCVLFAVKRLHVRPPFSGKGLGGASCRPHPPPPGSADGNAPSKSLSSSMAHLTLINADGASSSLVPIGSNDMNVVIEACLGMLDLLEEELPSVIDCFSVFLPEIMKMTDPMSVVVSCAGTIWPFVLEQLNKHKRSFRRALKAFVGLVFHSSVILCCREGEPFCAVMQQEYAEKLFELGEAKSGVFNVLVTHVLDTWAEYLLDSTETVCYGGRTGRAPDTTTMTSLAMKASSEAAASVAEAVITSMKAHSDLLIKSALFGPVHKKNIRMVEEVEGFIESAAALSAGTADTGGHFFVRSSQTDKSVRVSVVNFLMKLILLSGSSIVEQEKRNLVDDFLQHFAISLTKELARISSEKPRYYINSATHRAKLRLVQCLIITTTRINKVTAVLVVEQLLTALQYDNQLSVRYLIEWQTVLLLCAYPELITSLLLPCLTYDSEKRLSRMCSIFTITMHVGLCLKTATEKESYYLKVFPLVYQWTSSHHFIVRLYSQQTVFRMWAEFSSLPSLLLHFGMMERLVAFMKQTGDGSKFQHKMRDNIFFTTVKADADVSIEALFHTLPCLCHVIDEELISPELFELYGMELWKTGMNSGQHVNSSGMRLTPLKLKCDNAELMSAMAKLRDSPLSEECGSDTRSISHHLKPSPAGIESSKLGSNQKRQLLADTPPSSMATEREGDVQKKIMPWSNPASVVAELFPESSSLTMPRLDLTKSREEGSILCSPRLRGEEGEGEGEGGLVLVASLLNKIPNLGGLARTCEIFGVSELVISNVKIMEEKQFQSLSVTAEKWLTITEVKLPSLRDYLLSMRRKGYSLVGAEQTANSKDILNFNFKQNTVLVLGNEREGIPVPIIHLLDGCVEIPQFGMIRSLNAHVSGALLVWEYVKQHLVKREFSRTIPLHPLSTAVQEHSHSGTVS